MFGSAGVHNARLFFDDISPPLQKRGVGECVIDECSPIYIGKTESSVGQENSTKEKSTLA